MTPFVYENEIVFCLTMIAYILAIIMSVICFATSVSYKLKVKYVLPEFIMIFAAILWFCYLSDGIRIRYFGEDVDDFANSPCFMPTLYVIIMAIVMIIVVIFYIILIVKKRLSSLTAMSVKEAISKLPVSLCFYEESGRILFLNEQLINDCKKLTGKSLYNGNIFWSIICNGKFICSATVTQSEGSVIVQYADGFVTLYKKIIHKMDGKMIYELCGTDISREYALKKEEEQKNENLHKMNIRLRSYGEIVNEVTREKEILYAKIKVHDSLGSLILRTKKALTQDKYDKLTIISEWKDIISLIFAPDSEEDKFAEANKMASNINVQVFYDGKCLEKGTVAYKIFANAVFECVTNTARHADGTKLFVKIMENSIKYIITLTNNGKQPKQNIKEGGGLSSLRMMTENAGGEMIIESIPKFKLVISIPKEKKVNE